MSQEVSTQPIVEAAPAQDQNAKANPGTFDQVPIGGGSKFQFSEFPSDNDPPPAKKAPPVRKATKAKKQQVKVEVEDMPLKPTQPLDEIPVGGNNNQNMFDEKPIGKTGGAFIMSEFPQGQPEEAPATNYTMAQKLKSKAPKMRLSGMQDLLQLITNDPNNPDLGEVVMSTLLKQTTPANMQKSLQCLKAWMQAGKSWGEDEAKNTIENGYINGKANAKKLAMQIIDLMYETKVQMIQMLILVGFKNKTPKIIAGYNAVLNELLAIYGIKRMKYLKPYLQEVIRVIGAQKLAAVKTEGINTLRQAYKWMTKEVVEPMLGNLKEALKKQLDNEWQNYDKSIVMTAPKDIPEQGAGKSKGKKIDAYELSQAVDIFKKYNQKWSETVIKAEKWSQKKDMMEQFVKAASVPKLANTQNRHIGQLVRRLINDANFNVVLWTLKIIGVMSKGLRKNFAPIAKAQFSNIIGKFRQKRTQMVEQTFATLNDLIYCLALQDVIEDVKEGFADKAPQMKINLIKWIGKHIEQKIQQKGGQCPQKTKDALKKLFPFIQKLLEDGVAEVRMQTTSNVAKLQLLLGQDFLAPIKGKLKKPLPKVEPQSGRQSKKPEKAEKAENLTSSTVKIPKAGEPKSMPAKQLSSQLQKTKQQKVVLECFDQPTFEQSLQTLIGYGLPEQQVKNINAATAADRGKILNYLRQNPYQNFNAVVRVIRKAFKDWKQINVPMNKDLISYLQERANDICKPQTYVLIPYLAEKYLEAKFSEQILKIIGVMCERIPARFIIGHFLRYVKSPQNKKLKLNGQVCAIIAKIIQLVSIANCNLKQIAEYAKQTFNVNTTKKQAQELILCLYLHAGDSIKPFLDQNILKIMDGEFKNNKPLTQDHKRPKVEFQGEAASLSTKPVKKQSAKQDGKPRDLTVQVQKALPLMNDNSNWQKRKDGAQLLTSQLEFGGKVHFGNFTGDLISCLKVHINDTNKQLIKVFVHLAGLVLISLPQKDLKTCLKSFITALTEGLSDKNEQNRRQITQTLGRIGQSLGKQHLLNNFGPYLEGDKEGRLQVLNLILIHQDGISKSDIRDYPKGLANCLTDKNKDIRAAAQRVFEKVYQKLGLEVFRAITKDLRPAVAKDLGTFLDKFGGSTNNISSIASKGVSPGKANKEEPKPRATLTRPPPAPGSAQKQRSVSRGPQAKSFIQHDDEPHAVTSPGPFIAIPKSKVQGNQPFANKTVLQNERIQRQSNQVTYIWRLDKLQLSNEQLICNDIQNLINEKWAKKLLSMDYTKVNEVLIHFVKLSSKDVNYQDHFRQFYDVFFKYILMKLWGGQPAFCSAVIELVFPILSILQKKKAILTDFQVDLVIAIVRQYFISASLMGNKISENVYNIIKCLVALSSGERVLSKILKEFSLDLPGLHRHLRKETNAFYRQGLSRAIKNHLANHVGSGDTMQEASKIKQLKEDPQFVNILFQRYREDTLHTFGFRRIDQNTQSINALPQALPPQQSSSNHLNGSGVSYKPPVPPTSSSQVQSSINNGSFISVGDTRQKSGQRLPKRNDVKTATGDLRPSQPPTNKPYDKKNNPSLPQIQPVAPPPQQFSHSQFFQSAWSNPYDPRQMNLSEYPAPHPASPLSKHLNKLLPPNDNIITFFNTLFQESGEKIANQLTSNAKIIFGQILKSVQELIDSRKDHTPDKIVNQISLLQSCIKCPHIIKNIGELLGYGTSFALTQLVYEDEHKSEIYEELKSRNIDYKADNFIKSINGVMLRILENAHPHQTVNVLLQLLTYHSKAIPSSPKTISLVVKCLGRVSKEFSKDLRPESIRTFLIRAHQYLTAIDYDIPLQQLDLAQKEKNKEKIRTQDTASNIIKNIIIELCTAIRSQIWEHYEKSMYEATSGDRWIGAFISSLNIKPIQKNRGKSQQSRDNDELKKINDLLSKTKSFETGIVQLKKYTQKHQQFNVQEYFTSLNYDRKFIKMVIDSLDGQRRTTLGTNVNNEEQGPNENIQERIRRLRERFQDLQPEGEGTQQNPMNRQKPQVEQDPKQQRALQIKRRIEQMKNKMNSAVRKR